MYTKFATLREASDECRKDELCKGIYGDLPGDPPDLTCASSLRYFLCKELKKDRANSVQICNWEKQYGIYEITVDLGQNICENCLFSQRHTRS